MSVASEQRRLRRAFRAALLSVAAPAAIACAPSGAKEEGGEADASVDATLPLDASPSLADGGADDATTSDDGATPDASAPPATQCVRATGDASCYLGAYEIDATTEAGVAQDTCVYAYGCGLPVGLTTIGCAVFQQLPDCGTGPIFGAGGCVLPEGEGCEDGGYAPGDGGFVAIACTPCASGAGRRPAGLERPRGGGGGNELGAFLAGVAFEEEASVTAFARLRAELVALGAPVDLVRGAERAARDEIVHARIMGGLAERRAGEVPAVRVRRGRARGVAAIAAENAAEGCVRETYGALVARWQAENAGEGDVRRAYARIARDEARHAALAWAVARWIAPRLDARGHARVARARARALREVREGLARTPAPSVARGAGLPGPGEATALLDGLTRELALGGAPPAASS